MTLSTPENPKFLQQLKSGFKRVINWNKYLSKPELLAQNPNLNHLVEPSFQGINRLFVLAFENDNHRRSDEPYYLPTVEIKDYNIVINGENVLKIVKSLEDSGLLLKGVSETVQHEAKEQRGGFLSMLLNTLGASLLGDILSGKGVIRAGEGTIRAGYGSKRPSLKKF